jgi:PIN domain nuclease of toxin-antitoxin system
VILLDTNALIWLVRNHPRTRELARRPRLYISPASLFEIQMLLEAGRGRAVPGRSPADLADDPRWLQDEPPSGPWFNGASDVTWTRDPFDRLIVAHARLRGWKLATGDAAMAANLSPREIIQL